MQTICTILPAMSGGSVYLAKLVHVTELPKTMLLFEIPQPLPWLALLCAGPVGITGPLSVHAFQFSPL